MQVDGVFCTTCFGREHNLINGTSSDLIVSALEIERVAEFDMGVSRDTFYRYHELVEPSN
jgi:hypothetical protein